MQLIIWILSNHALNYGQYDFKDLIRLYYPLRPFETFFTVYTAHPIASDVLAYSGYRYCQLPKMMKNMLIKETEEMIYKT